MATAETFIDTFEPDLWARELSGLMDAKGKPLKHNLKSMGYEGDILIRCKIDGEMKTWGIERKTLTDALNSWMNKRLIRQVHDLSERVDYPLLFIIVLRFRDEPSAIRQVKSLIKRIEGGDYQTVRLHSHKVSEPDNVVDFLMGIPKVGKKTAAEFKNNFTSLPDLINRVSEIDPLIRTEPDRQTIREFLTEDWEHEV